MEDKELFELCKQVYEKFGWGHALNFEYGLVQNIEDSNLLVKVRTAYAKPDVEYVAPLYTSDYILEKLPNHIDKDSVNYELIMRLPFDSDYRFHYHNEKAGRLNVTNTDLGAFGDGDTPLKALLKLTLALHDAGELK